jgi:hypothetical protein
VVTSVDDVISTSRAFVDEIESAFANLGLNDKMPTLRDAYQAFVKAMITYHDSFCMMYYCTRWSRGLTAPKSGSRLLHLLELPYRKGSIVTLIQKLREWTRELKQALELDRSAPPYGDQH